MLTDEIERRLTLTRETKGRLPRFDTVAKALKIPEEDAKVMLNEYRTKHQERVRVVEGKEATVKDSLTTEKKKWHLPTIETLVIKFAHQLQYVGFFIATIVDVALAWFFFYSLGSGDLGKTMLSLMGLVLTAAKLWGWAYSRIDRKALFVGIFTVALSIFGNTAILRAEFELQAKTVLSTNTEQGAKQSPEEVIQGQIIEKKAELEKKVAARDSIDSTVEANLPMYNTLDKKVKESNKELTELNRQLSEVQKAPVASEVVTVEKTEVELDAWSVFRQWTDLDWSDPPRALAWFFALVFACLPELVIFATTPRKERIETP